METAFDLELSNTRAEVFALGENPEPRTRSIKTCQGQGVPTPIKFDTLPLESEEGDQCGDRDGAGESRGRDAERIAQSVCMKPTPGI